MKWWHVVEWDLREPTTCSVTFDAKYATEAQAMNALIDRKRGALKDMSRHCWQLTEEDDDVERFG